MTGRLQGGDGPTCEEPAMHELLVQLPDVEREVFPPEEIPQLTPAPGSIVGCRSGVVPGGCARPSY